MRRSLSPILRRELENLDKDADSRKSAMKALKSYVKDLDSKAIPGFLAQVSETKQPCTLHAISLYEVLARVHGPKIVPQIDNIMNTIVRTLSLSSGACALHKACAKVVPAIARYAIDPTTAEDRKRHVIHSLCKPLLDCLLGSQENVSSGAALCLLALVESDNWRFASTEMVNEVCQRVAVALDKHSQTNSHMDLVTALAKHNGLTVEAYARVLIKYGLQILGNGFVEADSQKQLLAIRMISFLMTYLDPKSLLSEMELVIKEMKKCQTDRIPYVTHAASEAMKIAKRILAEKCTKPVRNGGSSSTPRRDIAWKDAFLAVQSPSPASPESQTVVSSVGCNSFIESPCSVDQGHADYDRSVNRKLWGRFENGVMDVSLKDGLFSYIAQGSDTMGSEYDESTLNHEYSQENFTGFVGVDTKMGATESNTPCPQRLNAHLSADDVKIFTTPRKLIHSLQDLDNIDSGFLQKQGRMFASSFDQGVVLTQDMKLDNGGHHTSSSGTDHFQGSSESLVSSAEDVIINNNPSVLTEAAPVAKAQHQNNHLTPARRLVCGIFVAILATLLCLMTGNWDDGCVLVPT